MTKSALAVAAVAVVAVAVGGDVASASHRGEPGPAEPDVPTTYEACHGAFAKADRVISDAIVDGQWGTSQERLRYFKYVEAERKCWALLDPAAG